MNMSINFPHLGIYLDHVGKFISVNGFHIAYYGIIMGCSILLGLYLAEREAKRTGQNPDTYTDLVIYAIVVSIICARTYYVIFSWDNYKNDLLSIFNLRQGGIAIYGAVIGAVATVFVYSRVKNLSFTRMLDTACIGLVAGQILGRIWIEGLRTDQLQIGGTGIPVSQMLAGVLIVFSLCMIVKGRKTAKVKEQNG